MRNRKVVFASNTAWSLFNFRAGLIRRLVESGWVVVAVAPADEYVWRLTEMGCGYVNLPMDNKGTNPIGDLKLLFRFFRILRQEAPDVFLGFSIKPNVYGSIAARVLGIPTVNSISGLGTAFIHESWITLIVRILYRIALRKSERVCFENAEDRSLFVKSNLVGAGRTECLPVCGINLRHFVVSPLPCLKAPGFRFVLIARMLWDKGIGEYVEAARQIRRTSHDVKFGLVGFLNVENRTAISYEQIQAWEGEGVVNYLGASDDVRPFIENADCVVLPSYREGLSVVLREAAAMGRPLIASNATGCREIIDDGVTGYLVNVRDAADLAAKMKRMLELPHECLQRMGQKGREKMEHSFDDSVFVARHRQLLERITSEPFLTRSPSG